MVDINPMEGLENYNQEEKVKRPFIKIMQALSPEVAEGTYKAGDIISSADSELLAAEGTDLVFIPIYYYKDWTVWEKRTVVKRSFDRINWSDGTKVLPSELAWVDDKPPLAQEAINYVIISGEEFKKPEEEIKLHILSFSKTSYKVGKAFISDIVTQATKESLPMFGGVYSLKAELESNSSGSWYSIKEVKFLKKAVEKAMLISREKSKEVKQASTLMLTGAATQAAIVEVLPPTQKTEDTKPTEF